jgi:hypothetical protein
MPRNVPDWASGLAPSFFFRNADIVKKMVVERMEASALAGKAQHCDKAPDNARTGSDLPTEECAFHGVFLSIRDDFRPLHQEA